MKKIIIFLVLVIATFALANVSFTQLNVEKPGGVVAQPYFFRCILLPVSDGTYSIGLEGHLDLMGINASIGTYTSYPEFSFSDVYVGAGINLGGIFASINATTTSFETIADLTTYGQPKVAFGIANYNETSVLFSSWSRFELTYEPNNLLKLTDGAFELVENTDFLDASVNLSIESFDVGYFMFKFGLNSLQELVDGSFKYYFDMAIPLGEVPYIYFGQSCTGDWKVGAGLATNWINAFGLYELGTGTFSWVVNGQI
mgnify:CR=1 FL=1